MNDLCPKCRVVRDMRITSQIIEKKNDAGESQKILVKSYFCVVCNVFVRSEEIIPEHKEGNR